MSRGELWTAAGGGDYAGKPRPVVIVSDDVFRQLNSVTVCALTTSATESRLLRVVLAPSSENGLREVSRVMVDKITTVRLDRLGRRIGVLSAADMRQVDRAMLVYLGIASSRREALR